MSDLLLLMILIRLRLNILLLGGLYSSVVEGIYPSIGSRIYTSRRCGNPIRSLTLRRCQSLNNLFDLFRLLRNNLTIMLHLLLVVIHNKRSIDIRMHYHTLSSLIFLWIKNSILFLNFLLFLGLLLLSVYLLMTLWLLEWSSWIIGDSIVGSHDNLLLPFLLIALGINGWRYNLIWIDLILSRFYLFGISIIWRVFIVAYANGGRLLLRWIIQWVFGVRKWRALLLVSI